MRIWRELTRRAVRAGARPKCPEGGSAPGVRVGGFLTSGKADAILAPHSTVVERMCRQVCPLRICESTSGVQQRVIIRRLLPGFGTGPEAGAFEEEAGDRLPDR
jgi:hypothetical protein